MKTNLDNINKSSFIWFSSETWLTVVSLVNAYQELLIKSPIFGPT